MTALSDIVRGDRRTILVSDLEDENGNSTTFGASDVLRFTMKHSKLDADVDAIVAKSSSTGGITFTAGQSTATITLLPTDFPADMSDTPGFISYVWDLQLAVSGSTSNIRTIASGTGRIVGDITITTP